MTNWKEIDRLAKSWVKEAGQRIKQSMKEKMTIETKSNPNDLVTNIDKETERFSLKNSIGFSGSSYSWRRRPRGQAHIFGRRRLDHRSDRWYDELYSSKTQFCDFNRHFENGKGKIGLIYDVTHDELYHAFQGEGAYINNTKLGKMKEVPLEESILAINATWITENRRIDPSVLSPLVRRVRGTRSYGSAALELAYVAAGRMDVYVTMRLAPWDYAAGCILLDEVGGTYTTIDGKPLNFLENHSIVAGNPAAHRAIFDEYLPHE